MAVRNPGPGAPPPKGAQPTAPNAKNAPQGKQQADVAKAPAPVAKAAQPVPTPKAEPAVLQKSQPVAASRQAPVVAAKQPAPPAASPAPVVAPLATTGVPAPSAPPEPVLAKPAMAIASPANAPTVQPLAQPAPSAAAAKPAEPVQLAASVKTAGDAMATDPSGLQKSFMKIAEQGLSQSRAVLEQATSVANDASQSLGTSLQASSKGATDLTVKAFEMVGASAVAAFDHMVALSSMKTMSDAIALHGAFLRKQSEMALANAREFSELAKKAAAQSAPSLQKPKQP